MYMIRLDASVHCVALRSFIYSYLRFDRPFPIGYSPNSLFTGTSASEGHWPTRPLASSSWELGYPVQFSVCKAADDPQFMPGVCLGFHEWFDSGDGFCIGNMAPVSDVMPGCRGPNIIQKLNNKLGPYPIGNGLSKHKQLYV